MLLKLETLFEIALVHSLAFSNIRSLLIKWILSFNIFYDQVIHQRITKHIDVSKFDFNFINN